MNKSLHYLGFCLALQLHFSCQNPQQKKEVGSEEVTIISLEQAQQRSEVSLSDIFDIENVVALETDTVKSIMASVSDIAYFNQQYIALDTKLSNLRVFEKSGKFLYNIGKLGSGPGEYSKIFGLNYLENKKEVMMYCLNDMKMMWYQLDGTFIKQVRIPFYADYFTTLPNQQYAFYCNYNTSEYNQKNNLLITDENFNIVERYFPYSRDFGSGISGFLKRNCDNIIYGDAFSNQIYRIDTNRIEPIFKFDLGKDSVIQSMTNSFPSLSKHLMGRSYLKNVTANDSEVLCFTYVKKQYVLQGIYLKREKQLYTEVSFKKDDLFHLLGVGGFKSLPWLCGEYVALIEPDIFFGKVEDNPKFLENLKLNYPKVYEKVKNFKETDNPIILHLKLK